MIGRKYRRTTVIKRVAVGSTIAAVAGYVAGVLTAPKSGKATRGDIKNVAEKSTAEAEKDLKKLHDDLDKGIKIINGAKAKGNKLSVQAKKEVTELLDKAKDTKEKSSQVLGAVRAGKATDKDLNRAIKNANASLASLRKYLKK